MLLLSLMKDIHNVHIPVLLNDTLSLLAPGKGESYLDLTAGYGGHSGKVLEKLSTTDQMVLVDQDHNAIEVLKSSELKDARLIHSDFVSATQTLLDEKGKFDMILLDLGVSSPQLDNAERGFSFKREAPLDMRMDNRSSLTAAKIVNTYTEKQLVKIFKEYGDEHRAFRFAKAIIKERPFKTTTELGSCIARTAGQKKWTKAHPATKVFQAIRIATNEELTQLDSALPNCLKLLNKGGRLVVISFHSLEDRRAKRFFAENGGKDYEAELTILTRKPILGKNNDVLNPRARSATLRAAVKK